MKRIDETLRRLDRRERQTAAIAAIARVALASGDLQILFDSAVQLVANALDNEMCKVLRLLPGGKEMLLQSGVGWQDGLVGTATVGTDLESQAGYTVISDGPVIVEDLATERRFSGPQLLIDHGVVSGMSVIIGPQRAPWGVLGTHGRQKMIFTGADTNFIQSVAVILWHAIERKKAEDASQQADRRKDEFLAVLGHELRNPIGCIAAGLEIVRSSRDPSTIEQSHVLMERQVAQLGRLVDDLLEVSRIAKGQLQLQKRTVELTALIKEAVADNKHTLDAASHQLSVSLPDERIFISADPARLRQTIANLLNNAAKYTPPGGKIDLTAQRLDDGVELMICDNGIGIPADQIDTIFELFGQLEQGREMSPTGLGIGLNLVQTIVSLHDGRIEASSAGLGAGSEFRLWLPALSAAEPASASFRQDSPLPDQRRRA